MSVYAIAQIAIHDRDRYQKYQDVFLPKDVFLPIFQKYEGEILVVDEDPVIAEGEWPYTRTVVLRFPDAQKLQAWFGSAEYQELVKHRHAASKANIAIVKELDPAMLAPR